MLRLYVRFPDYHERIEKNQHGANYTFPGPCDHGGGTAMSKLAMMFIGLERFSAGFKRKAVQVGDHRIAYSEGGKGERGAPSKPVLA